MIKRKICTKCFAPFTYSRGMVLCGACGGDLQVDGSLDLVVEKEFVPRKPSQPPLSHEERGRRAWKLLHEYRLAVWSAKEAEAWFRKTWMRQIPRYGCNCSSEFKKILDLLPPRFETYDDFFLWTVDAHNAVNERLGRPSISLHEALTIWHQKQQPG